MSAPIAYGPARSARRIVSARAATSGRGGFWLIMLALIVGFIMAGAWLVEGVAGIGRGDTDCLHSARQVCGVFKTW